MFKIIKAGTRVYNSATKRWIDWAIDTEEFITPDPDNAGYYAFVKWGIIFLIKMPAVA